MSRSNRNVWPAEPFKPGSPGCNIDNVTDDMIGNVYGIMPMDARELPTLAERLATVMHWFVPTDEQMKLMHEYCPAGSLPGFPNWWHVRAKLSADGVTVAASTTALEVLAFIAGNELKADIFADVAKITPKHARRIKRGGQPLTMRAALDKREHPATSNKPKPAKVDRPAKDEPVKVKYDFCDTCDRRVPVIADTKGERVCPKGHPL